MKIMSSNEDLDIVEFKNGLKSQVKVVRRSIPKKSRYALCEK